jgi:hypothetical protein
MTSMRQIRTCAASSDVREMLASTKEQRPNLSSSVLKGWERVDPQTFDSAAGQDVTTKPPGKGPLHSLKLVDEICTEEELVSCSSIVVSARIPRMVKPQLRS